MATAAFVLAILGIIATALVGWLVHTKTSKLLRRINAPLIANIIFWAIVLAFLVGVVGTIVLNIKTKPSVPTETS